jgi:predicted nucleotidyltransferase
LEYTEQVSDASNDVVYYELKRFIELLYRNNPNLLELLSSPADCVRTATR